MKMIFSLLLLTLIGSSISASAQKSSPNTPQKKYDECVSSHNPHCLKSYISDGDGGGQWLKRPINDSACVALYQIHLKKCLFDYKHAVRNQQPAQK